MADKANDAAGTGPVLHDRDIREPLFDFLEARYGRMRILEEKTMGRSRADIVMVLPEAVCGIEIKSDADSYARLADQVRDYDRYYDYNYVVVGTRHALHIREHVPGWWGVITVEAVDGAADFYELRKPLPNPRVTWEKKLEILWRPELAGLQQLHDMPKYKDKSRAFVIGKIAERIPDRIDEADLQREMCNLLFERDYTTARETLADYRRGEISKQLDTVTDPQERLALLMQQAEKGRLLTKKSFRKKAARRRSR